MFTTINQLTLPNLVSVARISIEVRSVIITEEAEVSIVIGTTRRFDCKSVQQYDKLSHGSYSNCSTVELCNKVLPIMLYFRRFTLLTAQITLIRLRTTTIYNIK